MTTTGANYTGANGVTGSAAVTFAVQNTNAFAVTLTDVSVVLNSLSVASGTVCNLWVTSTCLSGVTTTAAGCVAGGISAPTWTNIATSAAIPVTGGATLYDVFPGLNYNIPASTTLRFAVQSSGGITYSGAAGPPSPNTFTGGGVTLMSGGATIGGLNVGYGGAFPGPANSPRWFTGSITFAPSTPCSGTPNPGNTTASVSAACVATNFTVGLQNSTTGTGVTYAWEFDNGGGWTAFGTNGAIQTVSQSVPTSYRCTVNCPAGGGVPTFTTSNPITVPMSTAFPVTFAGTTFPSNCWSLSTT
ncbi:MAG TPA: hypothetical protein PK760_02855, partial [Flavobacteriales bacterium]|nr:hypothetical protein [Flavobacteriales bacterium]